MADVEPDIQALEAAVAKAEQTATDRHAEYQRLKREADDRAARLRDAASAVGATPTSIRELSDQVRYVDPEVVEESAVARLEAELAVEYARQAVLDARRPELQRLADEAAEEVKAAQRRSAEARGALLGTMTAFNNHGAEVSRIHDQLDRARKAASAGTARRAAELTGEPTPAPPPARTTGFGLTQHVNLQGVRAV
jgi:hypothetical protein